MFLGVLNKGREGEDFKHRVVGAADRVRSTPGGVQNELWSNDSLVMCSVPRGMVSFDESPQPFVSEDGNVTLMFEGKIHNTAEIAAKLGPEYVNRSGCSCILLILRL